MRTSGRYRRIVEGLVEGRSDIQHNKRKRVWMVDKDGKARKVWKDADEDDDDSGVGVQDDGVDGNTTSRTNKSKSSEAEEEYMKRFGRKGMKNAKEIEEKGDRATT